MRSSPLLLFGASGALAANYTEHSRTPYNTSASTAATLAHSTGSATGYMFLNTAPTTLRTSVLPALSANWTASVSTYGAKRQKTESSSASPSHWVATNYTIAANISVAATHAPAPLVSAAAAPFYTASSRTNHTALANVTAAAPYAAVAPPTVSVAATSAPSSAAAYPSAWPLKNLSMPANGTSGAPWASPPRRPYMSVPNNATHNSSSPHDFSSSYNSSSSPPSPLPANGAAGASVASSHRRPYVFVPHNATYNSSSSRQPLPRPALASSAPAAYPTLAAPWLNASFPAPEPATASGTRAYEALAAHDTPTPGDAEGSAAQTASGPEIKTFRMTRAESAAATPSVEAEPTMR